MTFYEVMEEIIKPVTLGKGVGYALMKNEAWPLAASTMVCHSWADEYQQLLDTILSSGEVGPFWVSALAVYQPEDKPAISIEKQMGELPTGAFASVLGLSEKLLVIITDIPQQRSRGYVHRRMWCMWEIYSAAQAGIPVEYISYRANRPGRGWVDPFMEQLNADLGNYEPVDTKCAQCGEPVWGKLDPTVERILPKDEVVIREAIIGPSKVGVEAAAPEKKPTQEEDPAEEGPPSGGPPSGLEGGFDTLNRVVEKTRMEALIKRGHWSFVGDTRPGNHWFHTQEATRIKTLAEVCQHLGEPVPEDSGAQFFVSPVVPMAVHGNVIEQNIMESLTPNGKLAMIGN